MPSAVILTALPVEYLAVRTHLTNLQEEMHPQGTIYERGIFAANGQTWEVGLAEVGAGNAGAAAEAERAIAHFKPDVLLFVGIAGGIKDVAIGDVVAATDVYGYEAGKVGEGQKFYVRPKVGKSAHKIIQRARAEARKEEWLQRLSEDSKPQPRVFVAPIAAGEKVIASRESGLYQFLRSSHNDAIAVEMEGFGFLSAAFAYPNIQAIVIRGISDWIKDKNADDTEEGTEEERQKRASRNASAFAFELLANIFENEPGESRIPELPQPGEVRKLIDKALDSDQLNSLCQDEFPYVYNQFTDGQTRQYRIRLLLDYAQRHLEMPRLLAAIEEINPTMYHHFFKLQ